MVKEDLADIKNQLEASLEQMGIEIVDMQYRKENGGQMLRIFIDHEAGVTLELCTQASRNVKALINAVDFYYDHLEVSSPGLDRVIKKDKDLERFAGNTVRINMLKKFAGPKRIIGVLLGHKKESIYLEDEEGQIELPRDMISQVRLHPND